MGHGADLVPVTIKGHNRAMEMNIVSGIGDKMRHGKGPCTVGL